MTLATVAKKAIVSLAVMLVASLTLPLHSLGWAQPNAGQGATINGVVKFVGEVPGPQKLQLDHDTIPCRTKAVPDESLVIGREGGIRYAVVTLEGAASGKPIVPNTTHYLDCQHCRFVPHVLATTVGESVVIRDYDSLYHSLEAVVPGGKSLASWVVNPRGMTAAQERPTFVPDKPGIIAVICSAHPWMVAYVVVTDTPYYAVTDKSGHYQISGVPPGHYLLKVWTERLGQDERNVILVDGSVAKADFAFSLSGKGAMSDAASQR